MEFSIAYPGSHISHICGLRIQVEPVLGEGVEARLNAALTVSLGLTTSASAALTPVVESAAGSLSYAPDFAPGAFAEFFTVKAKDGSLAKAVRSALQDQDADVFVAAVPCAGTNVAQ